MQGICHVAISVQPYEYELCHIVWFAVALVIHSQRRYMKPS